MPVLQITSDGYIKGTKTKYSKKVVLLFPMMISGVAMPINSVVTIEGPLLAECLSYQKVREFVPGQDDHLEEAGEDKPKKKNRKQSKE